MGCFLACFGSSKDGKRRNHQRNKVLPRPHPRSGSYKPVEVPSVFSNQEKTELPITPVSEIRDNESGEQTSFGKRKKVTFDSNIKTYEPLSAHESIDYAPEILESGEKEKDENLVKSSKSQSHLEAGSTMSSLGSYPPNHRYQNCRDSDDEIEESDCEESDLEDEDLDDDGYDNDYSEEDDEGIVSEELLCDSLSSMESRTGISVHKVLTEELESVGSNRNARDRSGYIHSVLNPVENLTQWKAVKARGTPALKHQKENFTLDQEPPRISFSSEPSFKQSPLNFKSNSEFPKHQNQEIAVDASLSNWLSSSDSTPKSKNSTISFGSFTPEKGSNSPRNLEDRPILGALTIEELKQFSATSSPRKSPSRSPDDMPIIGSVGSYWSRDSDKDSGSVSSYKGIPNTTSKYREDKRVNWYSTPFETRLERALNRGAAEAYFKV